MVEVSRNISWNPKIILRDLGVKIKQNRMSQNQAIPNSTNPPLTPLGSQEGGIHTPLLGFFLFPSWEH